jgi:prophage regulatory protein
MNRKPDDGRQSSTATLAPAAATPNQRILRLPEVCALTGLGRSVIYQLQAEERIPQRVKLGARAVGWVEEEVQRWLGDRIAESRRYPRAPRTTK